MLDQARLGCVNSSLKRLWHWVGGVQWLATFSRHYMRHTTAVHLAGSVDETRNVCLAGELQIEDST
jgi:hypothetical protein